MKVFINIQGNRRIIQITRNTSFGIVRSKSYLTLYAYGNRKKRYKLFAFPLDSENINKLNEKEYEEEINEIREEINMLVHELTSILDRLYTEYLKQECTDEDIWYVIDISDLYHYSYENHCYAFNVGYNLAVKELLFINGGNDYEVSNIPRFG